MDDRWKISNNLNVSMQSIIQHDVILLRNVLKTNLKINILK